LKKVLLIAGSLLLIWSPLYLLQHEPGAAAPEPMLVLSRYLRASYARDYKQAYRFISAKDQRLKPEAVYIRERGAFSGFTLVAARKLADAISMEPADITPAGDRTKIKVAVKLPDAASLAPLLLDWDEEKLNGLPAAEQRKILASIDRLSRSGAMKMIEGEEEFALVKEDKSWRLALDWDAALRVSLAAIVPENGVIQAEPVLTETVVDNSEPFRVSYRVNNRSEKALRTRIVHHIEPPELKDYLDIVECALLLPTLLQPGEQAEYSTTYLVRGDLPENARKFNITYEFKLEP
jgi:hypothetical protein